MKHRVAAVEIATELGGGDRGILRIERAEIVRFDRIEEGEEMRIRLEVVGRVSGITPRYQHAVVRTGGGR